MSEAVGHHYDGKILKEYVDRFHQARIFVIGDIIMDEYVWGDVSRISPEAPVPVVEVKQEENSDENHHSRCGRSGFLHCAEAF